MSNETLGFNMPKFYYITMAEYQSIETKEDGALYFIKGAGLIYKGAELYGSTVKTVDALPDPGDAIEQLQYIIASGDTMGIYVLNAEKDGYVKVTKDNFLSMANFNTETNVLTLELIDGSEVEVELSELLNVYTGGDTDTASVSISTEGEVTVDVLLSEDADNALEVKDGLYVKKTPVVEIGEDAAVGEAADAKSVYDVIKAMAWVESV